jgi:hypothetical protein
MRTTPTRRQGISIGQARRPGVAPRRRALYIGRDEPSPRSQAICRVSPHRTHFALEPARGRWALRRYLALEPIAYADSMPELLELAFPTLREFAPCTLTAPGDPPRRWRIHTADGDWEAEPDPETWAPNPSAPS